MDAPDRRAAKPCRPVGGKDRSAATAAGGLGEHVTLEVLFRWHEGRSSPQRGLRFPQNGLRWAKKTARTSLCQVGNRP